MAGVPVGRAFFWDEGSAWTLAFMFVGRYGFLPDSDVPFGRLQPYIAVGPAIFFSHMEIDPGGSDSQHDLGLAVESGVRYMALKNVSVNLAFKYRYFESSYRGFNFTGTIEPTFHLFSGILGVAYHF